MVMVTLHAVHAINLFPLLSMVFPINLCDKVPFTGKVPEPGGFQHKLSNIGMARVVNACQQN